MKALVDYSNRHTSQAMQTTPKAFGVADLVFVRC